MDLSQTPTVLPLIINPLPITLTNPLNQSPPTRHLHLHAIATPRPAHRTHIPNLRALPIPRPNRDHDTDRHPQSDPCSPATNTHEQDGLDPGAERRRPGRRGGAELVDRREQRRRGGRGRGVEGVREGEFSSGFGGWERGGFVYSRVGSPSFLWAGDDRARIGVIARSTP